MVVITWGGTESLLIVLHLTYVDTYILKVPQTFSCEHVDAGDHMFLTCCHVQCCQVEAYEVNTTTKYVVLV